MAILRCFYLEKLFKEVYEMFFIFIAGFAKNGPFFSRD